MGLYAQLSQLTSAAPGGKQTWCVSDILRRLPTFISLVTVWPDLFDIFDQLMLCWTTTVSFGIYKLSFEVKLECIAWGKQSLMWWIRSQPCSCLEDCIQMKLWKAITHNGNSINCFRWKEGQRNQSKVNQDSPLLRTFAWQQCDNILLYKYLFTLCFYALQPN